MQRFRRRSLSRRLKRPLSHRCSRRLTRRIGRGPRANPPGQALRAFGKAIRARRRLLLMAPEVFDAAVTQRLATERRMWEHIHVQCELALDKVYGPQEIENRCGNGAETVQFSRRKRQRIENTSLEYDLWMAAGREAFARYQHLQPHRRVSLRTAAR